MNSRSVTTEDSQPEGPEIAIDTADGSRDSTQDPGFFSPVFGDIAAKMKIAIDEEVQRLLALGLPVWVDRGNGVEALYSLPDE